MAEKYTSCRVLGCSRVPWQRPDGTAILCPEHETAKHKNQAMKERGEVVVRAGKWPEEGND